MALVILAQLTSIQGKEELLLAILNKLIEPARKSEGCIQFDLHRDNNNPALFVFYERWETRDLWQKFMNETLAPHIADSITNTQIEIESLVVNEMTHIA